VQSGATISGFRWAELGEKVSMDLVAVWQRAFAPGWPFNSHNVVGIGKVAVETRCVILYEVEDSIFRLASASESTARQSNLKPSREYLVQQGRFENITEEQIEALQHRVDIRWKRCLGRAAN